MLIEDVEVNCGKDSDAASSQTSLVRNSAAAVMLIDWLVSVSSADQQRRLSESIYELCVRSSWNAMQCSKAGMITSIIRCLQQSTSSALDVSVIGE